MNQNGNFTNPLINLSLKSKVDELLESESACLEDFLDIDELIQELRMENKNLVN